MLVSEQAVRLDHLFHRSAVLANFQNPQQLPPNQQINEMVENSPHLVLQRYY